MIGKIKLKTNKEIKTMAEGGKKLGRVKKKLKEAIDAGVNADEIEKEALKLIETEGGKPSFTMVKGYSWATCVNVNDGVVHGVPKKKIVFKNGDIVSVDVGFFYKGFHTDTSFSVAIKPNQETNKFLDVGKISLERAIKQAKPGKRIYDVSYAMQRSIENAGYSPIKALVGHGIGKSLHEAPQIPCFVSGKKEDSPEISAGMVLAIEAMYVEGKPDVKLAPDGWTIKTQDGKMAGLFEETVAVGNNGPRVLTN
jgi:methionyl aminopeptidase